MPVCYSMRRRTFLVRSTCAAAALGVTALGCREKKPSAHSAIGHPGRESRPEMPLAAAEPLPGGEVARPEPDSHEFAGPDTMDDALALLSKSGPGRGNHAPMGAEALVTMGHGAKVVAWVEAYMRHKGMEPRPTGRVLVAAEQDRTLGDIDRVGDWNATFRHAIAEAPWSDVLRAWLPRLLPGLAGAATHGIIRTSHAVRSLGRVDNALRRNELADALAYWAAFYQPIVPLAGPGAGQDTQDGGRQPRRVSQALSDVPIVARANRVRGMTGSLRARANDPAFTAIAYSAHPAPGHEASFLSDMSATFAGIYVAHGAHATIPFIHAVTGPAALRLLLPYMEPETQRDSLRYGWQTGAGLWSSFAPGPVPVVDEGALPAPGVERWRTALDRAAEGGDVHAIKLAELCWRESRYGTSGRDAAVYLAAAEDVAARL